MLRFIRSIKNDFNPLCESDDKFLQVQKCEHVATPDDMRRHIQDRNQFFCQRFINIQIFDEGANEHCALSAVAI